jgi:hypothetical protein
MTTFVLYFVLFIMFFLIIHSSFRTYTQEGMTPYTMSNTLVETSKDHLEKITYMEDTCGNYMKSDYNSYIHSVPNALSAWLNRKTKQNITPESCKIYQTYVSDICGQSNCETICTNPNQYFDINSSSCKYCPIGYGVDKNSDNKCVPLETCPSDKKYTDNTGNCLPCPKGTKYDNGINCVNICLDYQSLNTDGTCSLICPLRNQRWDPINHCVNCPAGYIADGHNNCVPAPTCPPGQVLDSNNNCVAKCTVDWEHYDATTNSCVQTCRANQQYINGSCTDCPNGGMSDGNNGCLPGPTTPPLSCPAGYNLLNNKCESYCPFWEKNNLLHPTLCDPICNRNTQYFDQTTYKCLDCPPGKISDGNNGCIEAPTPAPTPLVCTPGYALNSAGTACNSICPSWRKNNQQNPSQCDLRCPTSTHTYYDTTQFTCMACPNGGIADNNNTCIAPTPAPFTYTVTPPSSYTFIIKNGYNILYITADCVLTFSGNVPSKFHTLVCGMGGAGGGNNNFKATVCGGGGGGGEVQISDKWLPNTTVGNNSYNIVIGTSLSNPKTYINDSNLNLIVSSNSGAPGGGTVLGQPPSTTLNGTPGKTLVSTTINSQSKQVVYGSGGGGGAWFISKNLRNYGNGGQIGTYTDNVYPMFTSYTTGGYTPRAGTEENIQRTQQLSIRGGPGGGASQSGNTYGGKGYYWLDSNYYGSGGCGSLYIENYSTKNGSIGAYAELGQGGNLKGGCGGGGVIAYVTTNGEDGVPNSGGGGGGGVSFMGNVVSCNGGAGGSGVVSFAWPTSSSSTPPPGNNCKCELYDDGTCPCCWNKTTDGNCNDDVPPADVPPVTTTTPSGQCTGSTLSTLLSDGAYCTVSHDCVSCNCSNNVCTSKLFR